jgi:hypothetical protein
LRKFQFGDCFGENFGEFVQIQGKCKQQNFCQHFQIKNLKEFFKK